MWGTNGKSGAHIAKCRVQKPVKTCAIQNPKSKTQNPKSKFKNQIQKSKIQNLQKKNCHIQNPNSNIQNAKYMFFWSIAALIVTIVAVSKSTVIGTTY